MTTEPLMNPSEVAQFFRRFVPHDRVKRLIRKNKITGDWERTDVVVAHAGEPDTAWVHRHRFGFLRPAARWIGGFLLFDRATLERMVAEGEGRDRSQDRARRNGDGT
jgi:hypothetical protein